MYLQGPPAKATPWPSTRPPSEPSDLTGQAAILDGEYNAAHYACVVRLVKSLRNAIIRAVKDGGIDPGECTFEFDDEGGTRITLGSSYLRIEPDGGNYKATSFVGEGPEWPHQIYLWTNVVDRARRWAEDVKYDIETPDLWAELQSKTQLLEGATDPDLENTRFTPAEQNEIAKQLDELREYVKNTYSLSVRQAANLDSKFDYLTDAASRFGRKDWILICITMLESLASSAVPPPETRHLLLILMQGIAHLFGLHLPELGGG
jgi:hypothetical protein